MLNAVPTAAGNLPATGGAQAALAPTMGAAANQSAVAARNGRRWYKADLHTHTPASNDYEQPGVTYLEWLRTAAERGLDIVAVTDHNTVAGVAAIRREIEWLIRLKEQGRLTESERQTLAEWSDLSNRVLVLPGFEFTATFGFHILGIFPPATSIRTLEHILLTLKVPPDKLDIGSTETGSTTDVLNAYKVIREYGGLAIAAHANSTHGVAMRNFPFGGQTKIAYTQDPNLDALEVTDLENRAHSTARFFNGTKSEYPRRMHALQGSDAHRLTMDPRNPKRLGIGERATELMLDEPSFEALATLLRSPQWDRTRPARPKDRPMDPLATAREEGNTALQSLHDSATKQGGKLDAVLADLCAFANSAGGTVYVGMSLRRDGPRALARPKPVEDLLVESVETRLTPPIDLQIDTVPVEGGGVLRLRVARGDERPYAVDGQRI
ncbi:MAG: RNA-binding domain-containing protein, partial [Caldilineaceae bacterium]